MFIRTTLTQWSLYYVCCTVLGAGYPVMNQVEVRCRWEAVRKGTNEIPSAYNKSKMQRTRRVKCCRGRSGCLDVHPEPGVRTGQRGQKEGKCCLKQIEACLAVHSFIQQIYLLTALCLKVFWKLTLSSEQEGQKSVCVHGVSLLKVEDLT